MMTKLDDLQDRTGQRGFGTLSRLVLGLLFFPVVKEPFSCGEDPSFVRSDRCNAFLISCWP